MNPKEAELREARILLEKIENAPNYITLGEIQDWVRKHRDFFEERNLEGEDS